MRSDTIILGAISGLVGNIFKEFFLWALYLGGITKYTTVLMIADVFAVRTESPNFYTIATGFATDWTIASMLGILLLLVIRLTGHDYEIIKGVMFLSLVYVFLYGGVVFIRTASLHLGPFTHFSILIAHLLFGLGAGWYIKNYDETVEHSRNR